MVGIDQTLVDIEAKVDEAFIVRYGLSAGHSLVIEDDVAEALYRELVRNNLITHQFAGGTIGNTMHNYSVLADDRSVLLGVMCSNIEIGGYAYRYLCNTSSRTDLNYLQGVDGAIGRCFTLISDSGERTFAISPGHMNKLRPESIPEAVIAGASALVLTSYGTLQAGRADAGRDDESHRVCQKHDVPVVLTLGTKYVIADNPAWWQQFLQEHVSILAMNEEEGEALTGFADPLSAADKALDWVDWCCAPPDRQGCIWRASLKKRRSVRPSIRCCRGRSRNLTSSNSVARCVTGLRQSAADLFAHCAVYGRPEKIMNTNGAGDGALAALLHDITANNYHRNNVPNSSKHKCKWLTYSSLAQVCKYANRVSYQVLNQHSPRLTRGLPEREDSWKRRTGIGSESLSRRERAEHQPVTTSPAGGVSRSCSMARAISRSPITT